MMYFNISETIFIVSLSVFMFYPPAELEVCHYIRDPCTACWRPRWWCSCCWSRDAPESCCILGLHPWPRLPRSQNRSMTSPGVLPSCSPEHRQRWDNLQSQYSAFVVPPYTFSPALKATAPFILRWFQLRLSTSRPSLFAVDFKRLS